jgi:hypothetical protein
LIPAEPYVRTRLTVSRSGTSTRTSSPAPVLADDSFRVVQQAIERFCRDRESAADQHADARERLSTCIASGVADGPLERLPRLLFE